MPPEGDSATGLPTTTIAVADPSTPEAVAALANARLDVLEADAVAAESGAEVAPGGGAPLTADDDCESSVECPEGATATVLALTRTPELQVTTTASHYLCPSLVTDADSTGLRIDSSVPVSLELTYTVDGEQRELLLETPAEDATAWTLGSGDGEWGWLVHCAQLDDLPELWNGSVRVRATDALGNRVETSQYVGVADDRRVPPSDVSTYGNNLVVITVPAQAISSVRFAALAVPFGEPAPGCDFDPDATIDPLYTATDTISPERLEAAGYLPQYTQRHAAAFIVPESSTISVCAGWVDGYAWGTGPARVFSQVLHSPDLAIPTVFVDSLSAAGRLATDAVTLDATVGGTELDCGTWSSGPGLRGVGTRTQGQTLCDYRDLRTTVPGWDAALVVTTTVTAHDSTGTRRYVLPVSPQPCGVGCDGFDDEFFDVPLESRSDLCIGNCAESYAGTVRLRVAWSDPGPQSWASEWIREGEASALPTDPALDRTAVVTLGEVRLITGPPSDLAVLGSEPPLIEAQSAEIELRTDRETTAVVTVHRMDEAYPAELLHTLTDEELTDSRTVRVPDLPLGTSYALTATFTDREGNVSVYSGVPFEGRAWGSGYFETDNVDIELAPSMTVRRIDGGPIAATGYRAGVQGIYWSSADTVTCAPDELTFTFDEPVLTEGVRAVNSVGIDITVFTPTIEVAEQEDCNDTQQVHQWWWTEPLDALELRGTITLDDLQHGSRVEFTSGDYIVTLHLSRLLD